MRPLSGSGSLGIMTELMKTHGPDSFIGVLASTMYGSSETTFYILAVYFGSVNIKNTRHAVPVGLLADLAGMLACCVYLPNFFWDLNYIIITITGGIMKTIIMLMSIILAMCIRFHSVGNAQMKDAAAAMMGKVVVHFRWDSVLHLLDGEMFLFN